MPCSRRQLNELAETFGVIVNDINVVYYMIKMPFRSPINRQPRKMANIVSTNKFVAYYKIEDAALLDFQSALPEFYRTDFGSMKNINKLNDLAYEVSKLSGNDFVKLKAVMESQKFEEISDAIECVNCLDNYGFTEIICSEEEFGREYLSKNLPTNFDLSLIENINLNDFGSEIMRQKGAIQTSYGMVYGKNMDLFSAVTIQPEQSAEEDIEEEATADLEIGMGMM